MLIPASFPHCPEMYFGSVCWSCSVPLPFSISDKTPLLNQFFSPLEPASFKSTVEMCLPCPKVMPLPSICPPKFPSPSPPKSIFPTFPPPSYLKMLMSLVPLTILTQCFTARKSWKAPFHAEKWGKCEKLVPLSWAIPLCSVRMCTHHEITALHLLPPGRYTVCWCMVGSVYVQIHEQVTKLARILYKSVLHSVTPRKILKVVDLKLTITT